MELELEGALIVLAGAALGAIFMAILGPIIVTPIIAAINKTGVTA